jgi:ribulose-phosphate 3-epimerase
MKISASFLSSKNIAKTLTILNDTDVDFIHVDIMDGKFVKNKTMPYREMKNIYKFTNKRLDVHLMVKDPRKYIKEYANLNTEYITIHSEIMDKIEDNLKLIKSYGIKCGIAINPDTEIKTIVPYLPLVDLITVMSVVPGKGGQEYIKETTNKLKELKVLLKEYKSKALIEVDGGINDTTKKLCNNADILVAGYYIVSSDNYQEKITSLR